MVVQVPVPLHPPPLHPVKTRPGFGLAVKVTELPVANEAVQMLLPFPQSMPPGLLLTTPEPDPTSVMLRADMLITTSNCADTI